jgi:hypothetical protein
MAATDKHLIDIYEMLEAHSTHIHGILDTQIRLLHYAAEHDSDQRFKELGPNVLCPICTEYLINLGKINETVTFVSKERYAELIEAEQMYKQLKKIIPHYDRNKQTDEN